MKRRDEAEPKVSLAISPETVCFIIVKAREFDVKDAASDPDYGSNPSDDAEIDVLEDSPNDPVVEELTSLIDTLSEDEQIDLVAIAPGSGAATIRLGIGRPSARRPRRLTTRRRRAIFSACRFSAISSRKASRFSAAPARSSRSAGSDGHKNTSGDDHGNTSADRLPGHGAEPGRTR